MDIVLALILLIAFLLILDQSSHMTITNASRVSEITGLGRTTIGFILLAFSTSVPELSVALFASFGSDAALSVGNVIGSNVVNVCLILGLGAFLVTLRRPNARGLIPSFAKEELGSLYFGLFVASIIPLSLIYLAAANWLVGLALITVFALYTYQLLKIRIPIEEATGVSEEMRKKLHLYVALTNLGIAGVIVSSYFIVDSAVFIAEFAGVPRTLIGATNVAFGTSLPELSTTVKAFLHGHSALGFGNIVGSCFLNITLILGVTLLVPTLIGSPLAINMVVFQDIILFSLIANLFLWYFLSMERLGWREGAILLFIYVLFLATTLGLIQLRVQPT